MGGRYADWLEMCLLTVKFRVKVCLNDVLWGADRTSHMFARSGEREHAKFAGNCSPANSSVHLYTCVNLCMHRDVEHWIHSVFGV